MVQESFWENSSIKRFNGKRQKALIQARSEKSAQDALGNTQAGYKALVNEHMKATSFMYANQIKDVVLDNKSPYKFLMNTGKTALKENPDVLNSYADFFNAAASTFTVKEKSGQKFMAENVEVNKIFTINNQSRGTETVSLKDEEAAWKRMQKGAYTVFDFETFGGRNAFGVQTLDQLTEYSFETFDNIKAKKSSNRIEGVVGITDAKKDEFIKKFIGGSRDIQDTRNLNGGLIDFTRFTELEQIQLNTLARMGSKETTISNVDEQFKDGFNGRYRVTKTIANEDVEISKENVLRGVERLHDIGTVQRAGSVNGLQVWEKDLADAMSIATKGDHVLTGHNVAQADVPWFNQTLTRGSKPFRDYYFKELQGELVKTTGGAVFDLLPLARMADLNGALSREIESNPNAQKRLGEMGSTALQQETLVATTLSKNVIENTTNAPHTAAEDTRLFNEIIRGGRINSSDKETLVEKAFRMAKMNMTNEAIPLTAAPSEQQVKESNGTTKNIVMSARKGLFNYKGLSGVIGYNVDQIDGRIRTSNGYEISPDGSVKSGFGDAIIKKDVSYVAQGLQKLTTGNDDGMLDIMKRMGKTDAHMAEGELYKLVLSPVREGNIDPSAGTASEKTNMKMNMPVALLGSRDEIQRYLNGNMIAFANATEQLDGSVKLDPIESGMKELANYNTVTHKVEETTPLDVIKRGEKKALNDSFNRSITESELPKIERYMKFSDTVKEFAKEKHIDIGSARNAVMDGAMEIAYQVSRGRTITKDMQDMVGLDAYNILSNNGKHALDYRSLDKAAASLDFIESARAPLNQLIQGIKGKKLGSSKEEQFVFKQVMQGITAELNDSFVQANDPKFKAANKPYISVPSYEKNVIQLSRPSSMREKNGRVMGLDTQEKMLRINLDDSPETKLINAVTKTLRRKSDGAIKSRLLSLAEENNIALDGTSEMNRYQVAQTIVDKIHTQRKVDPLLFAQSGVSANDFSKGSVILSSEAHADKISSYIDDYLSKYQKGTVVDLNHYFTKSGALNKNTLINDVVDNFLMDSNYNLKDHGFNDEQVKFLQDSRNLRRKDYTKYAEELINGVHKSGASLVFDADKGIFGMTRGGEYTNLANIVARDRFHNGVFYTQVGKNRLRTGTYLGMFGAGDKDEYALSDVKAVSGLGKSMDAAPGNLDWSIKRAIENDDDPTKSVERWLKNINSSLREGASVDYFNEKDMKAQGQLNISKLIDNLGKVKGIENMTADDESEIKELISRARKDNFSFSKMTDSTNMYMQKSISPLLQFLTQGVKDEWVKDSVKRIGNRVKSSANEKGNYGVIDFQTELEMFNNASRGIDAQNSFISFDEDTARKALLTPDEYTGESLDKRVGIGSNLRTELGAARDNMLSEEHTQKRRSSFELQRAAYSPAELHMKLKEAYLSTDDQAERTSIQKLMNIGNVTEGAAVMNSRVADAIIQGYDKQKIDFSKDLFSQELSADVESMTKKESKAYKKRMDNISKMAPVFKDKGDRGFDFNYGKGYYVRHGETLANVRSEYGNNVSPVAAKYDGFARFGLFTRDGALVSAKDAQEFLREQARKKQVNISNIQEMIDFAKNYYDTKMYVDKLDMTTYRKIQEDNLEKHMTSFTYQSLGALDDHSKPSQGIGAALDNLGLNHLKGRTLRPEFFNELLSGEAYDSGVLKTAAKGGMGYQKAIQSAGFKDESEFKRQLEKERHLAGDILQQVTGADAIVHSDDVSHKNAGARIKSAINDMHYNQLNAVMDEQGLARATPEAIREASQRVVDAVGDAFEINGKDGLFVDKNNRIGLTGGFNYYNGDGVNVNRLKEAYDAMMPGTDKPENQFDNIGASNGKVSRHGYNLINDTTNFQGTGRTEVLDDTEINRNKIAMKSGLKMTDRELNMLELQRYDKDELSSIRSAMNDDALFKRAFGHVLNDNMELADGAQDMKVLGRYTDEIRLNQFASAGDALLLNADGSQAMQNVESNLIKSANALQKQSGGAVSLESAKQYHSVVSNTQAMRFNNGTLALNDLLEEGKSTADKKMNFKVVSIGDLTVSNGNDGEIIMKDGSSVYNQNVVIDMKDKYLGGVPERMGNRYLAIGAVPTSVIGDEVLDKNPHKTINSIVSARQAIIDGDAGTAEAIERKKELIVEKAGQLNDDLSEVVFGKKGAIGQLSSYRAQHSAFGKAMLQDTAHALNTYSEGMFPMLDNVEIDGKKIRDHYAQGGLMDVKVFGMGHAERLGLFDQEYLDHIGSTKEDVIKQLEGGVLGLSQRHPAVYEGTKRSTYFVLNRSLGDEVIESAAGALTAKTDADGDSPGSELSSYTDKKTGRRVDSLEYALKGGAAGGQFSADINEAFQQQKSSNYINAYVRNPHFQSKLDKANAEAYDIIRDIDLGERGEATAAMQDVAWGKDGSELGKLRPSLPHLWNEKERTELMDAKSDLRNKALASYATEHNLSTADALTQLRGSEEGGRSFELHEDFISRQKQVIRDTGDATQADLYERAMIYEDKSDSFKAAQMGALKRQSAGEINLSMYKARKLRNLSINNGYTNDESRFLEHVFEASEEAFLSPKHSDKIIVENPDVMDQFKRAWGSATGTPQKGDEAGTDLLKQYFRDQTSTRMRWESESKEVVATKMDRAADMIQEIFNKSENGKDFNMFLGAVGQWKNGIPTSRIEDAMIGMNSSSMMSQVYGALSEGNGDLGWETRDLQMRERIEGAFSDSRPLQGNDYMPPTVQSLRSEFSDKMGGVKNLLSKVSGKQAVFGIAGMAGMSMLGAFVGGNPSEPTGQHAAQAPSAGGYESMPLSDGTGSVSQIPSGQGYVVNVNAQSPKGQAHAQEAIRQAVRQASGGSVNISMTTRNEYNNLDNESVTSILSNAFN